MSDVLPVRDTGGFLLSLLTESFAVRALIGSLAAAGLAALAVRLDLVRTSQARRIVVLAPVLTAAIAGLASVRDAEAYLPQLWLTTRAEGAAGQVLDLLGDIRIVTTGRSVNLLIVGYAVVVGVLLCRRMAGAVITRRLVRCAGELTAPDDLIRLVTRLSAAVGVAAPRVLVLAECPGGAFTTGVRRPLIVVDRRLLQELDERELEGLVAHELAHIRRRDPMIATVVGLFRDLTFFLPPLHLAARWFSQEQEESADEIATRHTHRPFALASSILKVYDSRAEHPPVGVCAVLPGSRRLAVALPGVGTRPAEQLTGSARAVALRVERLLASVPAVSRLRLRVEVALAGAVVVTAVGAGLTVPAWIAQDLDAYSLSFAVLSATPGLTDESPAFATFRSLAPTRPDATPAAVPARQAPWGTSVEISPRVETQAQLRAGVAAPPGDHRMEWRGPGRDSWEVNNLRERTAVQARPLWTLSDSGPQVGFFVVARPQP